MSRTPDWVKRLKKDEVFMLAFPSINKTILAQVIENCPVKDESTYFGTITVNYKLNRVANRDDLLYDDFSDDPTNKNSWYAHLLM